VTAQDFLLGVVLAILLVLLFEMKSSHAAPDYNARVSADGVLEPARCEKMSGGDWIELSCLTPTRVCTLWPQTGQYHCEKRV